MLIKAATTTLHQLVVAAQKGAVARDRSPPRCQGNSLSVAAPREDPGSEIDGSRESSRVGGASSAAGATTCRRGTSGEMPDWLKAAERDVGLDGDTRAAKARAREGVVDVGLLFHMTGAGAGETIDDKGSGSGEQRLHSPPPPPPGKPPPPPGLLLSPDHQRSVVVDSDDEIWEDFAQPDAEAQHGDAMDVRIQLTL